MINTNAIFIGVVIASPSSRTPNTLVKMMLKYAFGARNTGPFRRTKKKRIEYATAVEKIETPISPSQGRALGNSSSKTDKKGQMPNNDATKALPAIIEIG